MGTEFRYDKARRGSFHTDSEGHEWQWIVSGEYGLAAVRTDRPTGPEGEVPPYVRIFLWSGETVDPADWQNALWKTGHRRNGRRVGTPDAELSGEV